MNTPLVTVCIPTYNAKRYFHETLSSIIGQTYKNIEIIILDNCSTDGTDAIYKRFKDKRIKVIRHKRNIGSLANWNWAASSGSGELIAIFHADDAYEKTIIEEQVNLFLRHPELTCAYTRCTIINGESKRTGEDDIPASMVNRVLSYREVLEFMVGTLRSPYISPSCIARRSAFKKVGKFKAKKYPMAGDVDMHLRLTKAGKTYINKRKLVRYRHTEGQESINYSTSYTAENQIFGVLDDALKKQKITPEARTTYEAYRDWDHTVRAINILANPHSDGKTARAHLRRSLTLRRIKRAHKELLLLAITIAMLVTAHVGLGAPLAKLINRQRWKRHLQ